MPTIVHFQSTISFIWHFTQTKPNPAVKTIPESETKPLTRRFPCNEFYLRSTSSMLFFRNHVTFGGFVVSPSDDYEHWVPEEDTNHVVKLKVSTKFSQFLYTFIEFHCNLLPIRGWYRKFRTHHSEVWPQFDLTKFFSAMSIIVLRLGGIGHCLEIWMGYECFSGRFLVSSDIASMLILNGLYSGLFHLDSNDTKFSLESVNTPNADCIILHNSPQCCMLAYICYYQNDGFL